MTIVLLIFCAVAWVLVGVLFVYVAQLRQRNDELDSKFYRLGERFDTLKEELECTEEALEYETRIATDMQDARDAAHKCLELLLNDENIKELTK